MKNKIFVKNKMIQELQKKNQELEKESTCAESAQVQLEGARRVTIAFLMVNRESNPHNLNNRDLFN